MGFNSGFKGLKQQQACKRRLFAVFIYTRYSNNRPVSSWWILILFKRLRCQMSVSCSRRENAYTGCFYSSDGPINVGQTLWWVFITLSTGYRQCDRLSSARQQLFNDATLEMRRTERWTRVLSVKQGKNILYIYPHMYSYLFMFHIKYFSGPRWSSETETCSIYWWYYYKFVGLTVICMPILIFFFSEKESCLQSVWQQYFGFVS